MHYQLADPQMIGTVAVDSHSGEVYLIASLDRETKDKYHFKVHNSINMVKPTKN